MAKNQKNKWEYKGILVNKTQINNLNFFLQKKHQNSLEKIAQNPELIGIPKEVIFDKEIDLYDSYQKIGQLDLFFVDPKKNIVYYIEYKCNHTSGNQKCAKKQLLKALKSIDEKYRSEKIIMLYVSGEFDVKRLVGNEWKKFN